LEYKFSYSKKPPFKRLKVKLKKEIVTMGLSEIDPNHSVGTYIKPKDWNNLINDPDVILIDTRNNYEYEIGSFKGAINPNTETFREFPSFTKNSLKQYQDKKIAMFCTGGIRCEKSTAYLKSEGFENVFHLQGGILKYLEEVKEEESLWEVNALYLMIELLSSITLSKVNTINVMHVGFLLQRKIQNTLTMRRGHPAQDVMGQKT
jgi:UPF0176 protein